MFLGMVGDPGSVVPGKMNQERFVKKLSELVSQSISNKYVKSFPKQQILDCSKLKESANDNFKFDENSRKFSKRVENIVGKGEIPRYEQFLLFPQCF